jgi:hypothetical protein
MLRVARIFKIAWNPSPSEDLELKMLMQGVDRVIRSYAEAGALTEDVLEMAFKKAPYGAINSLVALKMSGMITSNLIKIGMQSSSDDTIAALHKTNDMGLKAKFKDIISEFEQDDLGERKRIRNVYFKAEGGMSGVSLPRDKNGVTKYVNFIDCDFHADVRGNFEYCQINGVDIPDGWGSPWEYDPQNDDARNSVGLYYAKEPHKFIKDVEGLAPEGSGPPTPR